MHRNYVAFLALGIASIVTPAHAELAVGAPAPDFYVQAAKGGEAAEFSLSQALKNGPVVLYFFPKAFTQGCTIEARNFAEAIPAYQALGATVVGVSGDDIATLKRFSVSECQGKFAVAADDSGKVITAYDAASAFSPTSAQRVSYVITPDSKVLYAHHDMSPDKHVANTLQALRDWKTAQK